MQQRKSQRKTAISSALKSIVSDSKQEKVSIKPKEIIERFGKITAVEANGVWVNFDGNPMKSEVFAEYDCADITLQELSEIVEHVDVVKIEFKDLALKKPVVKDIYLPVSVFKLMKYL